MNPLRLLTEAILSEHDKSVARIRGLATDPNPDGLNPSGTSRKDLRQANLHGYLTVRGRYSTALFDLVTGYLRDTDDKQRVPYAQLKRGSRTVIRQYFTQAFIYGMKVQAASASSNSVELPAKYVRWVVKAADQEHQHFLSFCDDLRHKRHERPDKRDWDRRVEDYVRTLDSIMSAGRVAATPENVLFFWKVNPEKEHCRGCQYLQQQGPFTKFNLPCTPRDGSTECLSNCGCQMVVKRVSEPVFKAAVKQGARRRTLMRQLARYKERKMGTRR